MLTALIGAAGAALIIPGMAAAQPPPPPQPPAPNVNAFEPVSPVDYSAMDGSWYAFGAPGGITCVLNRQTGGYGCSGPLPGAPDGANLVSGGMAGAPTFANTGAPAFDVAGEVKQLPANSRISFRSISCGTDGVMMSCINAFDQTGFIIRPEGSVILSATPMIDRADAPPFFPRPAP